MAGAGGAAVAGAQARGRGSSTGRFRDTSSEPLPAARIPTHGHPHALCFWRSETLLEFNPGTRRRLAVGLLGTFAVAAIAAASLVWVTQSRADDPQSVFPRAAEAGKDAGDAPAARVNGVEIPKSTIATMQVLMAGFPESGAAADTDTVVAIVVRRELFRQEAARRGLLPSEDEITQAIVPIQQAFQKELAAGKAPTEMVNIIEGQAKTGHPIENWPNDPVVRKVYGDMLAEAALARDETKNIPQDANGTRLASDRMDQLEEKLRKQGSVEIYE